MSSNRTCIPCIFYLYSIIAITATMDGKYKLTIRCSIIQGTISRRPGGRQLLQSLQFFASLTRLLARQGRNKSLPVVMVLVQHRLLSRSSQLHQTTQPGSSKPPSQGEFLGLHHLWAELLRFGRSPKGPPPAERAQHTPPATSCIITKRRKTLNFHPRLFKACPGGNAGLF